MRFCNRFPRGGSTKAVRAHRLVLGPEIGERKSVEVGRRKRQEKEKIWLQDYIGAISLRRLHRTRERIGEWHPRRLETRAAIEFEVEELESRL